MIVGLCGRAGSGKTTAAEALVARGFASISFAAPLKRMFAALDIAPSPRDDPRVWRETPHPLLCGNTPRQALQTLGTEWGRDCLGADFWVRIWAAEAANHAHVVADDVRFPNEAAAIRGAGGLVIRIDRAGAGSVPRRGCRSPSSRKVSLSGHLTAMTYLVQIIYFLPLLRRTPFRTPHDRDGPHHLPLVRVSGLPVRNWMPATA